MIIVGCGLVALMAGIVATIARFERVELERQLALMSANEMTSLHALIQNVMAKRPEDGENIGVAVFNNWFDSRNIHYPGKVWSAWGPLVVAHMKEAEPTRSPKLPVDDVDREALAAKSPVGRLVSGFYRYSLPIVLGVTEGAKDEVCFACHGAMGMKEGDVIAVLSSSLSTSEAETRLHTALAWLAGGGVLAIVVAVLGVRWSLNRIIVEPIGDMTGRMNRLAGGDTGVVVPALDRPDEVGDMARAVQVFRDNAIAKQRMESDATAEALARDERMRRLERQIAEFDRGVTSILDSVTASARQMIETARAMADSAGKAYQRADSAARQAREANENVRLVATAADQLNISIAEIGQQVGMSNQVATSATVEANAANDRVQGLAGAANRIGAIIEMITGIAEQTNLLALNATVEAARAGEAGKGFAVVASEVKNLARQTVVATDQIASQITTIQDETGKTVTAIGGIGTTIASMDGISTAIAQAVDRQGAATRDMAGNIEHAASGTNFVFENITGVSRTIQETDRSAREVLGAVEALQTQAQQLRAQVDGFLAGIRDG